MAAPVFVPGLLTSLTTGQEVTAASTDFLLLAGFSSPHLVASTLSVREVSHMSCVSELLGVVRFYLERRCLVFCESKSRLTPLYRCEYYLYTNTLSPLVLGLSLYVRFILIQFFSYLGLSFLLSSSQALNNVKCLMHTEQRGKLPDSFLCNRTRFETKHGYQGCFSPVDPVGCWMYEPCFCTPLAWNECILRKPRCRSLFPNFSFS